MEITLSYHWEGLVVNVIDCNSRSSSPHTKEKKMDVDYNYDCEVTTDDIVEYLAPSIKFTDLTMKDILNQECGIRKAVALLGINKEKLEDNEDFIEFLKQKYENKALEEFNEGNESY